jgi:hypothetical protein
MAEAALNRKNLFTNKWDLSICKKLAKWYICSIALYGVETWTFRKVDQKYLESCQIWCSRRMEVRCTNRVGNDDEIHSQGVKEYVICDKKMEG